ncbi:hypothetical protein [Agromyces humatus]|uniref:Uncharacterized protein n=1 Tax=Agromyces humatus TaxID=279573 RepID=A0ABN2K603_9MICO|nr:hypothetical protein [Agromyces humatus]
MSERDRNEATLAGELHAAADAPTPRAIDIDAMLGASRAKRRARRTAVIGGAGALAAVLAVGGLVFGMQGGGMLGATTADSTPESGSVAESAPDVADDGDESGPVDAQSTLDMPYCGAPVDSTTDAATAPLSVRLVLPETVEPGTSVDVDVIVTNDGDATVSGTIRGAPGIEIDDDRVLVWHSSDPAGLATTLELAPGEALRLPGSLETRRCRFGDEPLDPTAMADLPPLTSGSYGARAVVGFDAFDSGSRVMLVSPTTSFIVE